MPVFEARIDRQPIQRERQMGRKNHIALISKMIIIQHTKNHRILQATFFVYEIFFPRVAPTALQSNLPHNRLVLPIWQIFFQSGRSRSAARICKLLL
jgi:hypothetical protein